MDLWDTIRGVLGGGIFSQQARGIGKDFLFGKDPSMVSTLNPMQQKWMQQYDQGIQSNPLYNQGSDYVQKLLSSDPEMMKQFEAPFMQNFQQNIAPMIAERFAGAGTGGSGLSSSGLYNSLAQAGKNLQTDLAGLRGGLQMQGLNQALNFSQQPYTNLLGGLNINTQAQQPGSSGALQAFLIALAQKFAGG